MNLLVPQYAYRLKSSCQEEEHALLKHNQQQNDYFSNRLRKQGVVSASLSPLRNNTSSKQDNVQIIKQAKQDRDGIEVAIPSNNKVAMNHTVKKQGRVVDFHEENHQNSSVESNQSTQQHHQQQFGTQCNSNESSNIAEVLIHQNKDIADKVMVLTKETERVRNELRKEKEEKDMLYKRIDSLLAEKAMFESKLTFSSERENEKKREIQSIEKQKKELTQRVNELIAKIQEQSLAMEESALIQQETEAKVEELINENARVIKLFETMSGENLANLEEQLIREKQVELRNQQQENEIRDLQRSIARIEKERDETAQKLNETEIERLGQEIKAERMIVEVMEITEQKEDIQKQSMMLKEQMEGKVEELVKSVNSLNIELESAISEKIRVEEEIAVLRQSYLEVRQEIILTEEQHKQERELRLQIESQLRELQSGLESIEQKYAKSKEMMTLMECKMKEYEDQGRQERQLISELREELTEAEGVVQTLQEEKVEREEILLREKQNEVNKVTSKLMVQSQRQLADLSKDKEQVQQVFQSQIELLTAEKEDISRQQEELKGQIVSMQEELNSRATQIAQLISANSSLRALVEQNKQTHQNQIQEMKIHMQHVQKEKDNAEQAKNDLQIQLDSSIKKNQTILDLNDQLNHQGTQQSLRQQLSASRLENEQNIQRRDEEIRVLKETVKTNAAEQLLLKEEIDLKKKLLINLQKENSQFRKQISFALPAEERTQKLLETQSEQNAELMKKLKENEKTAVKFKDQLEELKERYARVSQENRDMKEMLESSNDTARTFNQLNVLSQANQKLAEENQQLYDLLKLREDECNFLQRNLNAGNQKRQ